MKLLSTLLLCAAVLGGTAGLPANNEYLEDASMEELQSTQEEEEFAFREETGDDAAADTEVGELLESNIQGEDTTSFSEPDSVEYADETELSDDEVFREVTEELNEDSLEVTEYNKQTSSDGSIQESDSCALGGGLKGRFSVYIRYARNLPDTDRIGQPDPYVQISAVNSRGQKITKRTPIKYGTTNPTFNQRVDFGGDTWVYFRIRVWDFDSVTPGMDDPMTQPQIIRIKSGIFGNIKHCVDARCRGFLRFDYSLSPDRKRCSPNPCRNGGTCIEGIAAFTCRCRSGYIGQRCQTRRVILQVFARYGRELPDRDGSSTSGGKSDPYIQFTAKNSAGKTVVKITRTKQGTHNPVWNQRIFFPVDTYRSLKVQVFDSDVGRDDELSKAQTFSITPGQHRNIRHSTKSCSGYILFDYTF